VNFQSLYFIRVFKKSKGIFVFVVLFAIMQYHFFAKREYTFPWFTWDMYSKVEQYPDTVAQTELFVNNQRIDITSIPIWQEETITHTFKMYNWQLMNDYNDPIDEMVKERTKHFPKKVYSYVAYKINNHKEETKQYPAWFKQYLEKRLSLKINTIEFKAVRYSYNIKDNKFTPVDNWTIQKFEYE
jgi:hypothetical protein